MGDPKKIRKKYDTPVHPWIKTRIDEERRLAKQFGTRNKKELWKMETILKNFKDQAKKLIALETKQAKVETEHLYRRIQQLGLAKGDVSFDLILGLTLDDIMSRRLQTIVYKKGLSKSVSQARQFIVHEHVVIGDKKVTSPSYLVSVEEEAAVGFAVSSPMISTDHPERASPEKLAEIHAVKESEVALKAAEEAKKAKREAREKEEGIEEVPPEETELEEEVREEEKPQKEEKVEAKVEGAEKTESPNADDQNPSEEAKEE